MFSIRDFIMNTLKGMYGHYPDFQIREYALNWYAKGKLTEEDLAEIELMLNPPIPEVAEEEIVEGEEIIEETTEETADEITTESEVTEAADETLS